MRERETRRGPVQRGEQIERGRNLVCPCLFSLIFFFFLSPQSFSNDFRTGTIKHHSGNQSFIDVMEGGGELDGWLSRERSCRGDAAAPPPPFQSFGTLVVVVDCCCGGIRGAAYVPAAANKSGFKQNTEQKGLFSVFSKEGVRLI